MATWSVRPERVVQSSEPRTFHASPAFHLRDLFVIAPEITQDDTTRESVADSIHLPRLSDPSSFSPLTPAATFGGQSRVQEECPLSPSTPQSALLVGWYSETRQERQVAQRPFRCNFVHFAIGYLSTEPILVVVLHRSNPDPSHHHRPRRRHHPSPLPPPP